MRTNVDKTFVILVWRAILLPNQQMGGNSPHEVT